MSSHMQVPSILIQDAECVYFVYVLNINIKGFEYLFQLKINFIKTLPYQYIEKVSMLTYCTLQSSIIRLA